jgi:uncharacterized protein HemY
LQKSRQLGNSKTRRTYIQNARLHGLDKLCMLTDMKQDRQQLVTQANAAETPDQIKVATVALKRWQASNPNDPEINTLLGQLAMRETWLRIKREW